MNRRIKIGIGVFAISLLAYLTAYIIWRHPFTVAVPVQVETSDGTILLLKDYPEPSEKLKCFHIFLPLIRLDGGLHGDESEWASDHYGFLFHQPENQSYFDWIMSQ
jgi:hypothetical protein